MNDWVVDIQLNAMTSQVEVNNFKIRKEDSLSPCLSSVFCLALIPLISELNNSNNGYQIKNCKKKINHLL